MLREEYEMSFQTLREQAACLLYLAQGIIANSIPNQNVARFAGNNAQNETSCS